MKTPFLFAISLCCILLGVQGAPEKLKFFVTVYMRWTGDDPGPNVELNTTVSFVPDKDPSDIQHVSKLATNLPKLRQTNFDEDIGPAIFFHEFTGTPVTFGFNIFEDDFGKPSKADGVFNLILQPPEFTPGNYFIQSERQEDAGLRVKWNTYIRVFVTK